MPKKRTAHLYPLSTSSAPQAKAARVGAGDSLRDSRIKANLPMVRWIARAILWRRRDPDVDLADLCAYGAQGLVEASDRFDEARGVAFRTFARRRIAGAILDGLRKERDWFGRRARHHVTLLRFDDSQAGLTDELLACVADRGEVAETRWNGRTMCQPPADGDDRLEALGTALDGLPDAEREVVRLHFYEGRSLTEVGREMDIGRSWVSRLRARALAAIRTELRQRLGP
jgi:RNA polymerase sigma factor FliA